MSSSKIPYIQKSSNNSGTLQTKINLSKESTSSIEVPDSYLKDKAVNKNGFGQGTTPLRDGFEPAKYNYQLDRITTYGTKTIEDVMDAIHTSINFPNKKTSSSQNILLNDVSYYNRFKVANPNIPLNSGFSHIFFVAPSCNILAAGGDTPTLQSQFAGYDLYEYAKNACPRILNEISEINNRTSDFMMLLSNYVSGFSLSDEYINTDTYGKGYTGWKIAFGKNNIESRTANSIDISFSDDKDLHIYQLHRLWVEYISGVYRGKISPTKKSLVEKILDYTGAIYYILTAEDNETVLFWSKYYGVFPSTIPSTQYSYSKGNVINNPEVSITYQYSFKKEYDPFILTEFNYNSCASVRTPGVSPVYLPTYDSKTGNVGNTYVGSPFIELVKTNSGKYCYKLRFTKD